MFASMIKSCLKGTLVYAMNDIFWTKNIGGIQVSVVSVSSLSVADI